MQFKHPEILYFLFLLIIPILVHLFQLRRFKKEYFTNVRFLKELSIQTRKSSKLKKWLLLATRLLILAAMIFAFAQPFFNAKDSRNATNELYIILDNSFSMQAKGQKGELLKRAIEDLLADTPENQSFSLLTNSETFWNTDIRSIRKDLQNLGYSASKFSLESQMAKIRARKSAFNKDVIIITDAVGLEENQLKSIDSTFNTQFIIAEAQRRDNVSIDSVFLSQSIDKFYEIRIKLSAYGDDLPETPVALYNGKKLIAKTLVKFNRAKEEMAFTIPKEDFHGFASIRDNGLSYDNQIFFSISKPQKTNIVSIGDAAKSGFLARIYTSDEFNYTNYPITALDYNLLEKQDAVILNELTDIPQSLQTTVKAFVEKGGNLIFIPSTAQNITALNSFAGSLGNVRYNSLSANPKQITKISFGHPLYSGVFEKRIDNFQYPETKSGFQLSGVAPALAYEDGSAFLGSVRTRSATMYLFSAPVSKENSNFQNSPLIVPSFYNMAQSASKMGISSLTIGSKTPLLVDAMLTKDEILEIRNETEKFIPVQEVQNAKARLIFNEYPQTAGNFGVFNRGQLVKNISFNYPRTEGNPEAADLAMLSDYKIAESIDSVFNRLQADRTDNELWKLFVILSLIFLACELFIQKFVK